MLNFPGSSSKQMSHCIDIHLENKSIDTVILHVGVNDLLNGNSQSNVDNLTSNNHKIINELEPEIFLCRVWCIRKGVNIN